MWLSVIKAKLDLCQCGQPSSPSAVHDLWVGLGDSQGLLLFIALLVQFIADLCGSSHCSG